ncbi:hypothetical protein [Corallococcus exercitus]|uniref:Uncharacterized protein n=1 Tax=Corallococcus exercitus TaxID=2316736 RepID=A0A7Y4NE87_9BACT|nr:hypothetical protein [Corallococcus exercitus]NOK11273.1 hypothetical protein [Corallococcus exercitus]
MAPHPAQRQALNRWVGLVACVVLGAALGIAGDFLTEDSPPTVADVLTALLLSPVAVTVGGAATTVPALTWPFIVGGLLFWPVLVVLSRRWLRQGTAWALPALLLWCWQGFFQAVHRLWMILSA